MALSLKGKTARDATGAPLVADQVYTCIESYAGNEDSCARGTRLRGDHPKVVARPYYFAPVDLDDATLRALRVKLADGHAEFIYG